MAQRRQQQSFEIPVTFSLNNILSIVADHLSKKALLVIYPILALPISGSNSCNQSTNPVSSQFESSDRFI
jgi:hypothetical protein